MAELREYGVSTTIYFPLIDKGGTDYEATPVTIAAGDATISKDGAAFVNTTNNFAHLGGGIYSLVLTATEMQAAKIVIKVIDQTATKEWEDQSVLIETYGNASAEHVNPDVTVAAMDANVITATSIASAAITAAKFGAGAIDAAAIGTGAIDADAIAAAAITAAKFGAGAIDANAIAASAITAAKIATAAITSAKFDASAINAAAIATDAITAAKIAADAIGASELATDAVNEIRDAILADSTPFNGADIALILGDTNELQGDWTNTGRLDTILDAILADTGDIQPKIGTPVTTVAGDLAVVDATADRIEVDTQDIQSRLPAALVSGRMDSYIGAMGTDVITAASIAAAAGSKIADIIWRRSYASIRASSDGDAVSRFSPLGALAALVNKWSPAGSLIQFEHEDGTAFYTRTPTTDRGARPIRELE